jgi:hypothetical protein
MFNDDKQQSDNELPPNNGVPPTNPHNNGAPTSNGTPPSGTRGKSSCFIAVLIVCAVAALIVFSNYDRFFPANNTGTGSQVRARESY